MNTNITKSIVVGIIIFLTLGCVQRDAEFYFQRGANHQTAGNYELAIRYFTKAINIDSKDDFLFFARGTAYNSFGKIELAISDFERAIELNPKFIEVYFRLANVYAGQDNAYLTAKYLSKIISIDPLNARAHFFRGLVFRALYKYEEAIADLYTAIELGRNCEDTYYQLAIIYDILGNSELELQTLNRGIDLHPNSSMLFFARAELHEYLNYEEKAISDFKRATELGDEEAREILREDFGIEEW